MTRQKAAPGSPAIVALVATYQRVAELERLLDSLERLERPLAAVVVVDNGSSPELRRVVEGAACRTVYVDPGQNLGCGGGLRRAGMEALALPDATATHILVLDDDAVLQPDTLEKLLAAMESEGAELSCPMTIDADGRVNWIPGIISPAALALRRIGPLPPADFHARVGLRPVRIMVSFGICMLLTRSVYERAGFHRDDFWIRGEDLEFSMRCLKYTRGIFVPTAVAEHLPPHGDNRTSSAEAEYLKNCALLQNNTYIALHVAMTPTSLWGVQGTLRRFLFTWGIKAIPDAIRALWRGAVEGVPAGAGKGETFRARFERVLQ